jgi:hypothetical protein
MKYLNLRHYSLYWKETPKKVNNEKNFHQVFKLQYHMLHMLRISLNVKNMAELSNIVHTLVYTRDSMLEIPYKYKTVSKPFLNVQGLGSIKTHIGENLYKIHIMSKFLTRAQTLLSPENSYWREVLQI